MNKKIIFTVLTVSALLTVWSAWSSVSANALQFLPTFSTSSATSSPSYMTAGTATSSVIMDSYLVSKGVVSPYATDKAVLLIQFVGSSTSSVLNTNIEYSQDGIDWYQSTDTLVPGYATTSEPVFDISNVPQYRLIYASSTAGLASTTISQSTTTRAVNIMTPTRYVRAIFTETGAAGAVWSQFIPERQTTQ